MIRRVNFSALFLTSLGMLLGEAATSQAALFSYEGFDYPNTGSALLNTKAGGSGWGGAWTFSGTAATANTGFNTSQDDTSLDSASFPFTPTGDRVLAMGPGPGPNNIEANRLLANPIDMSVEGNVMYASFLFNKATGPATGSDNMEFNFLSGMTGGTPLTRVRVGSTSAERFFIHNAASPPAGAQFETLTLDSTYFVVMRLVAHAGATPDVYSAITYAPTDTVPTTEPTTWEGNFSEVNDLVLDGIRLWIGTVTTGRYDEIRIGDTWSSVTAVPEPMGAILVLVAGLGLTSTRARSRSGNS